MEEVIIKKIIEMFDSSVLGTVISSFLFILWIFRNNISPFFYRRSIYKEFENLDYFLSLPNDKFREVQEVVKDRSAELIFYKTTGIWTNPPSISLYYKFKNRLGGNYDWSKIRLVLSYLNVSDRVEIQIKTKDLIFYYLKLFIACLIFLISLLYIFLALNFWKVLDVSKIYLLSVIIMGFITSYFMLMGTKPFIIAQKMEKDLKGSETKKN